MASMPGNRTLLNRSKRVERRSKTASRDTNQRIRSIIDNKIAELTAETDSSIMFEWDNLFETDIEQLKSIKLNSQTNISLTRTFPPQVKPVVLDYKVKQLPTAYSCKKSSDKKAPGELNNPSNCCFNQ
ncbi:hypothetical protein LOD99_8100 [Oopsacas minuta]|uniref:Uncharacterized protein n=1 Tax=Oopsacas minuta TaxID=111878 RepID=A0AAV7JI25_9METZ|nr:hypothetical protein LOD99_8100 [Oopsacas minuta]